MKQKIMEIGKCVIMFWMQEKKHAKAYGNVPATSIYLCLSILITTDYNYYASIAIRDAHIHIVAVEIIFKWKRIKK